MPWHANQWMHERAGNTCASRLFDRHGNLARVGGAGWVGKGRGFCTLRQLHAALEGLGTRLLQSRTRQCLHQDLLGANVVEDGGEGGLIEVEGGVAGEEEARFHPMEKVDLGYVYKRILC